MNASLVYCVAVLSAGASADDWQPVYRPSRVMEAAVRGQNPVPVYEDPYIPGQPGAVPPSTLPPGTYSPGAVSPGPTFGTPAPTDPGMMYGSPTVSPYGAPMTYDPFLGPPPGAGPFGSPFPGGYSFTANGPQPYRFGWTSRYNAALLPESDVRGGLFNGDMEVFEFNSEWRYTTPVPLSGWIWSFAPQFNLRTWEGPDTNPGLPAGVGLPGNVFRFATDLELATPLSGPWSVQLGFTPAIASDLERNLTSDAWQFDGRGILFYRHSPQWLFAFGAGFWDRVNDRVLPYAGAVFTPDDRWEFRILFPESRISYYLGVIDGFHKWLYVRGEFHSEAYEIELDPTGALGRGGREQVEISDWRLLLGLRMDQGLASYFIEGGWVFDRQIDFLHGTPGSDITTGFIARIGARF